MNGSATEEHEGNDGPRFPETNDSVEDEDDAEETDCEGSPIRAGAPPQPELTVCIFSRHTRRELLTII